MCFNKICCLLNFTAQLQQPEGPLRRHPISQKLGQRRQRGRRAAGGAGEDGQGIGQVQCPAPPARVMRDLTTG